MESGPISPLRRWSRRTLARLSVGARLSAADSASHDQAEPPGAPAPSQLSSFTNEKEDPVIDLFPLDGAGIKRGTRAAALAGLAKAAANADPLAVELRAALVDLDASAGYAGDLASLAARGDTVADLGAKASRQSSHLADAIHVVACTLAVSVLRAAIAALLEQTRCAMREAFAWSTLEGQSVRLRGVLALERFSMWMFPNSERSSFLPSMQAMAQGGALADLVLLDALDALDSLGAAAAAAAGEAHELAEALEVAESLELSQRVLEDACNLIVERFACGGGKAAPRRRARSRGSKGSLPGSGAFPKQPRAESAGRHASAVLPHLLPVQKTKKYHDENGPRDDRNHAHGREMRSTEYREYAQYGTALSPPPAAQSSAEMSSDSHDRFPHRFDATAEVERNYLVPTTSSEQGASTLPGEHQAATLAGDPAGVRVGDTALSGSSEHRQPPRVSSHDELAATHAMGGEESGSVLRPFSTAAAARAAAEAGAVAQCARHAAEFIDAIAARTKARRAPSHFFRYWPEYACVGTLSSVAGWMLFRRSRWNGSDELDTMIADGREAALAFWREHFTEPLRAIYNEIARRRYRTVEDQRNIATEKAALQNMLYDFASERIKGASGAGEVSGESLRARAARLDMSLVMPEYEKELRKPVMGILGGDIPRMLLIQMQKLKLDVAEEMAGIDQLLRENELNIQIAATVPICLGVYGIFVGSRRLLTRRRRLMQIAARESVRECEKILTRSSATAGHIHGVDAGMLLLWLDTLSRCVDGVPSELRGYFFDDIDDLRSADLPISQKLHVIERMHRTYEFLSSKSYRERFRALF